jgi:oligopeptide transport system substrate-binding protein
MALDKDIIAGKVLGQGQRPAWVISQPDIGGGVIQQGKDQWVTVIIPRLRQQFFRLGNPLLARPAIAASSMWKKNLGVEVKLQNQEWKTMLDTMHTHNFDDTLVRLIGVIQQGKDQWVTVIIPRLRQQFFRLGARGSARPG